jgi:hypothetical protein
MAIAWACEEHNSLQAELVSWRRKQRQMLFAVRNFQLLATEAEEKMLSAKQQVDLLIRVALDEISAAQALQEQNQHPLQPDSPRCFDIQLPSPPSQLEEPGNGIHP